MSSQPKLRFFASDVEASGLLWDMVKQGDKKRMHNFCSIEIRDSNFKDVFLNHPHSSKSKKELQEWISSPENVFIIHNAYTYDLDALEMFGFDTSKMKVIDTLPLSWYLHNQRQQHGLAWWGEEFGVPKPPIEDWENLTQEEYDHRVLEDCKIQRLLWMKFCKEFGKMYGCKTQSEVFNHPVFKFIQFKGRLQQDKQRNKWKFNIEKGEALFEKTSKNIELRREELISVMPSVPKYSKRKPPAKPYKLDGSLSATGQKWKDLTEERGLPFTYTGEIEVEVKREPPNPASSKQVKEWLFDLGWIPETFEYKREPDGSTRKIPQINIKGSGGLVCPSISRLAEEVPQVKALEGLGIETHRNSMVKGWLENHEDGYLIAGCGGFTNTLRLKHRNLVNIPSGRVTYGMELRGMLEARVGCTLIGSDLSALENRWKFHHQFPLDPDFVNDQMSDDFDPHMSLAVAGGLMTADDMNFYKIYESGHECKDKWKTPELLKRIEKAEADKSYIEKEIHRIGKIRAVGKQANYALQYGSGVATLARTAKISEKEAKKLKAGYDKLNWSINVIAQAQRVKAFENGKYLYNPINKIWYPLKAEKDRFSTLIQGSGSYTLDLWILKFYAIRKKAIASGRIKFANLLGDFHDEVIIECPVEDEAEVKKMLLEAIDGVNKSLKLSVDIGCDIKVGKDYSAIH